MNSSRARPTPSLGNIESANARSGSPTLIMIFIGGGGWPAPGSRCRKNFNTPS